MHVCACCVYSATQAMDELDVSEFRHGGVNITGFTLLPRTSPRLLTLQGEWGRADPAIYPGAGNGTRLKVKRTLKLFKPRAILKG